MSVGGLDRRLLYRQASRLLQAHFFPGSNVLSLVQLLGRGDAQVLSTGALLCSEGSPGNELFFLLEGKVRVMRRDAQGQLRELATIDAPALVGHMSLVDGSPRSATCTVAEPSTVVQLDRVVYQSLLKELSPEGSTLRRLLLSSLSAQLTAGNTQIRTLTAASGSPAPEPRAEKEGGDISPEELLQVAGVLDGWTVDLRGVDRVDVVRDPAGRTRRH
jgi:CRP-like cAMP-binding protein